MWAVNVSVADVRTRPVPADFNAEIDRDQETQVLFNEEVEVGEKRDGWIKIQAVQQERFRPEMGWTGYPGWIREDQICTRLEKPKFDLVVTYPWASLERGKGTLPLPMGTYLQKMGETGGEQEYCTVLLPQGDLGTILKQHVSTFSNSLEPKRLAIIESAKKLIGHRYTWGGLCPEQMEVKSTFTSIDCSGLVHLAHRVQGIKIPRDADCQFKKCHPIEPQKMQPADLIFLSPIDRERITHVILFIEGDQFIDANIADRKVVISTASQRFGISFRDMANKMEVKTLNSSPTKAYRIHFGRIGDHA